MQHEANSIYIINMTETNMLYKLLKFSMLLSVLAVFAQSCAPPFSDLQSARTIGKGRLGITPKISDVSFTDEGETESSQTDYGVKVTYGISPNTDLIFGYENISATNDLNYNVIGIGPKFGILQDRIAFYIPVGRALDEGTNDSWQVHPTFLFTPFIIENVLDINFSTKFIVQLCDNCDNYLAFNLGAAVSNDISKWALRPEFGILLNPGESGYFTHFSLGATYSFDLIGR